MQVTTTDGIVIKLTDEQIADIDKQVKTKAPKTITERIKTVEDAYKELKMEHEHFYPKHDGDIAANPQSKYRPSEHMTRRVTCAFAVSSEKRAKSVLAMAKLSVIADALNEGVALFNNNYYTYTVVLQSDRASVVNVGTGGVYTPIRFRTWELADYCVKQFNQLWWDYLLPS